MSPDSLVDIPLDHAKRSVVDAYNITVRQVLECLKSEGIKMPFVSLVLFILAHAVNKRDFQHICTCMLALILGQWII